MKPVANRARAGRCPGMEGRETFAVRRTPRGLPALHAFVVVAAAFVLGCDLPVEAPPDLSGNYLQFRCWQDGVPDACIRTDSLGVELTLAAGDLRLGTDDPGLDRYRWHLMELPPDAPGFPEDYQLFSSGVYAWDGEVLEFIDDRGEAFGQIIASSTGDHIYLTVGDRRFEYGKLQSITHPLN